MSESRFVKLNIAYSMLISGCSKPKSKNLRILNTTLRDVLTTLSNIYERVFFAKVVQGFQPLTTLPKCFMIIDV